MLVQYNETVAYKLAGYFDLLMPGTYLHKNLVCVDQMNSKILFTLIHSNHEVTG